MTASVPPCFIELPLGLAATAQADGEGVWVFAITSEDGREVGAAVLVLEGTSGHFEDVWIAPHLRRKGVATALYDRVEAAGIVLHPSEHLDENGLLFWEVRSRSLSVP
jgi:GNAT superfamily N-acetyltransferase